MRTPTAQEAAPYPMSGRPIYGRSRFPKLRKLPDGALGCRGCGGPITEKRRKTWCSQACHDKYDPFYVKKAVNERDKFICQMCGHDHAKAKLEYYQQRREWADGTASRQARRPAPPEYDHIIPFCEGGLTTAENMRTLCHGCHVKRTTIWRRARAEARQLAIQPGLIAKGAVTK